MPGELIGRRVASDGLMLESRWQSPPGERQISLGPQLDAWAFVLLRTSIILRVVLIDLERHQSFWPVGTAM